MLYHPTVIILIATALLIITFRHNKSFRVIALIYPVIAASFFYNLSGTYTIDLFNLKLISQFDRPNKLIGSAFILVLFAVNLYAIGNQKKLEIILGSAYGAFSFFCILAGDFISIFLGLELMMIASSAIIFIGGHKDSLKSAKRYFLTHLLSSNLILIGITYLIVKGDSTNIIPIAELITQPEYSTPILSIMLIGMIINIAAFPFSGWMVTYYRQASLSGFLYLISFTTKVSLFLLIKLFAGCYALQYIAIIMITYTGIKAVFEDNLLSLLCYLSLLSMGFMLLGISQKNDIAIMATSYYLFVHIIYKSLLSISCASIIDHTSISLCSELKQIKNPLILTALAASICVMINIPGSITLFTKILISHPFKDSGLYFVIICTSIMTIAALPWKKYFTSKQTIILHLNIYTELSIYFMTSALIIITFSGFIIIPFISDLPIQADYKLFSWDSMKQLIIIAISISLAFYFKIPRLAQKTLNLPDWLGEKLFYLYNYLLNKSSQNPYEPWSFKSLERQNISKFSSIHNQQTAIFIVFTLLIIMLVTLITS